MFCEGFRWTAGGLVSFAVVVAVVGVACAPAPNGHQPPTNLLLITLDTLRADHLGHHGYERDTSPGLDRFAAISTVFLDVTCSIPTTLPSHVSIFSGQPPRVHGVTRNGQVPQRDVVTMFDLLSKGGVRTAAIVSAGVLQHRYLEGMGFEHIVFDRPDTDVFQVAGDVVSDQALRWLERYGEQPFALWLHYFDTHEPYTPPPEFARRFVGSYDGPLANELETDWLVSLNLPEIEATLTDEDRRHIVNLYDAEIAYLDHQVSRVLNAVMEMGLGGSTLVVIVADHGQAHGEDGFWGHGERLLEPVIKVSMMIREPGQQHGHVVESAVETLDVMPTVAEFFGMSDIDDTPGRSLVSAVRGEPIAPADRRIVLRRDYPDLPERFGLVSHRVHQKGTHYREVDGPIFHIGRVTGDGGLDGENFFEAGSQSSAWFEADVAEFAAGGLDDGAIDLGEDLEMLRALGYTQ
jgi:arylsulfatase